MYVRAERREHSAGSSDSSRESRDAFHSFFPSSEPFSSLLLSSSLLFSLSMLRVREEKRSREQDIAIDSLGMLINDRDLRDERADRSGQLEMAAL